MMKARRCAASRQSVSRCLCFCIPAVEKFTTLVSGSRSLQLSLVDDQLQVEAKGLSPDINVMDDPIEGRAAFIGILCHARIVHQEDRRALIGGNIGGAGGFDEVGEDEIDICRGQNMPGIIARPDLPAIRELSVEGS
jgi:hypothetical protein